MSILKIENICFAYDKKQVLKNISYEFEKGHIYSIVGKSGAGKTTLLSVLSGLAKPTSGEIYYDDKNMKDTNKYEYRSKYVGVVFQAYNLLTKLTALENVVLSMDISSKKIKDKKKVAYELLERVGLSKEESNRRVLKLSGGQQQRVAIARALSYDPEIILADEPTGNLDSETQKEILTILRELANAGKCIILVTHSDEVARMSDYVYQLK
ncbi:MAG: ABC transporter ATP-binding protein [Lachnospiraceae bacterium]|nr:ABC transporter ATP-binding protein [Lachnospiraceae bacterium]MBQ4069048.1 ABC transporter ATP-binding protein [Lachnospiraceae bacterium]